MAILCKQFRSISFITAKQYSGLTSYNESNKCKVLVVGGGAGGCSVAWRLSKKLKEKEIVVLEPSIVHYYQPLFSLVAAGIKQFQDSKKRIRDVLPPGVVWLKDHAYNFDPCNNVVYTQSGEKIYYDFMVIAIGLKNDYNKIPGLLKELNNPHSCVTTTYSPLYCEKTWCCLQKFKGGHAIFTFPRQAGKCSGAALKIMLLADDYWRKQKTRDCTNVTFNSGGNVLFGVQKYSTALNKIVSNRGIAVNCSLNLTELTRNGASFVSEDGKTITFPYNFLHVTPPMSPPVCVTKCTELVTDSGFLDVDKYTLQHRRFSNIYGIGDCTSTPNTRQSYVVERNLLRTMKGKEPIVKYDGYGACAVLTSYKSGILPESVYDKIPYETFPFDQSKEHKLIGLLTKNYFPYLYWKRLIKGKWNGPRMLRKVINPLRK